MVLLALHSNAIPIEQNFDFGQFDQSIDENVKDHATRGITTDVFDYGDELENADLEALIEEIEKNPKPRFKVEKTREKRRRHRNIG